MAAAVGKPDEPGKESKDDLPVPPLLALLAFLVLLGPEPEKALLTAKLDKQFRRGICNSSSFEV